MTLVAEFHTYVALEGEFTDIRIMSNELSLKHRITSIRVSQRVFSFYV